MLAACMQVQVLKSSPSVCSEPHLPLTSACTITWARHLVEKKPLGLKGRTRGVALGNSTTQKLRNGDGVTGKEQSKELGEKPGGWPGKPDLKSRELWEDGDEKI